jgi:hypothetical protein
MKIIVECKTCGNRVEIESETLGKVAYIGQSLLDNDFDIFCVDIDVELPYDSVDDPDDIETKLKEIRIDCQKCGDYICLNF